jgi:vacuolar-type H+-ATPase subunit I/STV1
MDFLNDIGKKITETAKTVTKKSENLVETTKINLSIGNEEDKIKRIFTEIGSELYKSFLDGESHGEYFDEKCTGIKEIEDNINSLREKLLTIKGHKSCGECNVVIDTDVKYCPNCGAKASCCDIEQES